MSLALAAPHPTRLRRATLPARGRDERLATRSLTTTITRSRIFGFLCDDKAAPSLPFTGRVAPRSGVGWGFLSQETTPMANAKARALRKSMTPHEVKLWVLLRQLRPQGFHFRRQAPLEGYILDFVCFRYRIIVEADGSQHGEDEGGRATRRFFRGAGLSHAAVLEPSNRRRSSRRRRDDSRASARERRRFPVGEQPMSDEWKKSLPFPTHWLSYLSFKLVVLALATLAALRLWGVI